MRPLAVLVLAESLLIALLAVLWLAAAPAAADHADPRAAAPDQAALTNATGAVPASAAAPERLERRQAAPLVPAVTADDPLGILLAGTVRSSDGAPVADANVYFRRGEEYRGNNTQPNGTWAAIGLQPGEWELSCRAEGYSPHAATVTLDQRSFQQFDIELKGAYVVKVKIQNAAGEHLPDLLAKKFWMTELGVVASDAALSRDLPVTENSMYLRFGAGEWRTNSGRGGNQDKKLREAGFAGQLLLDHEPPVHAALVLRHVVLQRQRIESGQRELVFTIEADEVMGQFGTVRLRLVDADSGQPLPKARIELSNAQSGGGGNMTDDDGRVALENVAPGLLHLSCWVKDREYLFRYVRMPAAGKLDLGEIRMSTAITVTGTAVDPDGKPVTDAHFQYTSLDGRTFPQPLRTNMMNPVDASGQCKLPLGRHRYVVFAQSRSQGFGYATVDASNGTPPPVTITLRKAVRVGFRVPGDTTQGFMVTISDKERSPVRAIWLGGQHRVDGTSLPHGTYTVEIHDGADRQLRSFTITVGSEPLTIDIP